MTEVYKNSAYRIHRKGIRRLAEQSKDKRFGRYTLLDEIRGLAVINMIAYHGIWDLVYIFGVDWQWYRSEVGFVWQQCICWTFIFLSGFCQPLGKTQWKRGLQIFLYGGLISFVTIAVMPQNQIMFGILTLIGSCTLLMIPLDEILKKIQPVGGFMGSMLLFFITRNINRGYLGFGGWNFLELPDGLYQNLASTYLGFPMPGFYSTDYFSIFPWMFLFVAGYFFYWVLEEKDLLRKLQKRRTNVFEWIGRHSLEFYMIHQPLIYVVLMIVLGKR